MTAKKIISDFTVVSRTQLDARCALLKLTGGHPLPEMRAGQFAEILCEGSDTPMLRRPISLAYYSQANRELWLLVAAVGRGSQWIASRKVGDTLNCLLPLGNGFSLPTDQRRVLLVGGGVGVAPIYFQGRQLAERGIRPTFLLGARTADGLLMKSEFEKIGTVAVTTEDGSEGERGFVTDHSLLNNAQFDLIQTCGPTPMMKAVAAYARRSGTDCEASLENLMACGLGACLCCVEKTTEGNLCVCKDGPVFNTQRLLWHN